MNMLKIYYFKTYLQHFLGVLIKTLKFMDFEQIGSAGGVGGGACYVHHSIAG